MSAVPQKCGQAGGSLFESPATHEGTHVIQRDSGNRQGLVVGA